jgi:hypothetical protein
LSLTTNDERVQWRFDEQGDLTRLVLSVVLNSRNVDLTSAVDLPSRLPPAVWLGCACGDARRYHDWAVYPVLRRNNCYSFAVNFKVTETSSQLPTPGRFGADRCRAPWNPSNQEALVAGAEADGLEPLSTEKTLKWPPKGYHYAALLVVKGTPQFHWLRLDHDGFWFHKPRQCAPTGCDNADRPIRFDRRRPDGGLNRAELAAYRWVQTFRVPPGVRVC